MNFPSEPIVSGNTVVRPIDNQTRELRETTEAQEAEEGEEGDEE